MILIGYDKIKALKYNKKLVKAEISKAFNLSQPLQLLRQLDTDYTYKVGKIISLEQIKADFQRAYNELDIDRTAKAADISNLFYVKSCRLGGRGKQAHAYRIIAPK